MTHVITVVNAIKAAFHIFDSPRPLRSLAKTFSNRALQLCGNHFLAIATITAIIWKPAYMETAQRSTTTYRFW